ncbi:hypothetical protein [Branchiibius hedensis]|uniref:hypothetical protein n=1 Tax=Branchiibius hedensis TaxID=672460 RepID=UPI001FEBD78F|nr:hypothetical protein [Branchiibius hedensis]
MITGLQMALAGGGLVGLGLSLLIWRLVPAQPDLGDALERLSPEHVRRTRATEVASPAADSRERLGQWALKTFPAGAWARVPRKELALLRISPTRFYGEKVLFAVVGLITPPLLTVFFTVIGLNLPFVIPVVATVGLAVLMFFLPDYNARDDAKKARDEFNRALGPTSTWSPWSATQGRVRAKPWKSQPKSATAGCSAG